MTKPKATHCVLGNNAMRCLHCGVETPLPMPMSLRVMNAMSKDFTDEHRRCIPSDAGAARFRYATPAEWINSWDTGASSIAIYRHMSGMVVKNPAPPQDPSDFGRCYRLLWLTPEWRARIGELGTLPGWTPLVEAWPRLEALYEEILNGTAGDSSKLYALMRELLGNR